MMYFVKCKEVTLEDSIPDPSRIDAAWRYHYYEYVVSGVDCGNSTHALGGILVDKTASSFPIVVKAIARWFG